MRFVSSEAHSWKIHLSIEAELQSSRDLERYADGEVWKGSNCTFFPIATAYHFSSGNFIVYYNKLKVATGVAFTKQINEFPDYNAKQ